MPEHLRSKLIGLLVLVGVTLAVYWPATHFDFLSYDDAEYLFFNPNIQHGINRDSVTWALESTYASNWHPLTWISHMADWSLYGNQPGGHHRTNILLHTANTALLFWALARLTGKTWRSALVAALFAWHPLHVESVAWVAERKDVLSMFFMLLTLLAYMGYVTAAKAEHFSRPTRRFSQPRVYLFYFAALGLFALGLMCKPMLVTLPVILLLLDFWPLHRTSSIWETKFFAEKIPFFILSALDAMITVIAQQGTHSVVNDATLPLPVRLSNATVSCVRYLGKTLWPAGLAVPYPYEEWSWWQTAGAAIILLGLSAWVLSRVKTQPFLAVGWFWFLVTLLPVIGLVQVGSQAMADRYTYLPLVGIFIMAAWVIPAGWLQWPRPGLVTGAVLAGILVFLLMATEVQLQYWRNSVALFGRAVAVTSNNVLAEYNLGEALGRAGDPAAAAIHYQKALEIIPNRLEAVQYDSKPYVHFNLGLIYRQNRRWAEAETQFREYLQAEPRLPAGHANLGIALLAQGKVEAGTRELEKCLRINPGRVTDLELLTMTENAYAEAGLLEKALPAALRLQATAYALGNIQIVEAAAKRISAYQAEMNSNAQPAAPDK